MSYIDFNILSIPYDITITDNDIQKAKDIFINRINTERMCSGYDEYFIEFGSRTDYNNEIYITAKLLGNIEEVVYGEGICTEKIRKLRNKKRDGVNK